MPVNDFFDFMGNCENNVLTILCEHIGIFIGKDFICKKNLVRG
jgi:hypothetical protein